ncbi:MAG: hypothetical protein ACTSRU_10625 [Candidatus Hodarchaeales archaeon]
MTAAAMDDAWMEACLVAISIQGGSDIAFAAETETIDPDLADKDIEGIVLVNGGRITSWKPEGDSTITFEAYSLEAGTDTGVTAKGWYDLLHTVDASVPIRIINDRNRAKYRVLVLWTNDPTVTTAEAITTDTYSALRIGMADGHFTSVKPSFTEGILKWTIMYKCAAFDKQGAGNIMVESCAGTTVSDILPAIAAYTTSNKFS